MKLNNLYIVSNWETYAVTEAMDPHSAVEKIYNLKNYRLIPHHELTDRTVTHVMCCVYTSENMVLFNNCSDEASIVLLMDTLVETNHFQKTNNFYA